MQTLTRNPLADPGLLGVNAGPALPLCWVRRCLVTHPRRNTGDGLRRGAGGLIDCCLYRQQGGGQLSPVRLTLAGVALAACWKD